MEQIELIREEIERRINGDDARSRDLKEILSFIDSLPKEKSFFEQQYDMVEAALGKLTDKERMALFSMIMTCGGGFEGFGSSGLIPIMLGAITSKKDEQL